MQGALHLDVVTRAPRLPRLGETLMGSGVDYAMGGKGANQAVAAARCGARAAMAGRVGTDGFAATLLAGLDAAGVDRSAVLEVDGPSGMSVAVLDAHGDYGAVVVSGANLAVTGEEAAVEGARVCLIQNEIPEAANLALARRLPEGCRLVLNAAPARALPEELRARVDLLVVNAVETADLLAMAEGPDGRRGTRGTETLGREVAERLRALAPSVIVTLGARGLILAGGDGTQEMPAPAIVPVSAHGAGDAFCGALAAFLAKGAPLSDAARRAQGYAARIVATEPARRHTVRP